MIPDTEEEAPEIRVEHPPMTPDEAMVEVAEAMTTMTKDPGGYHVEITRWWTKGGESGRVKVSKHVKIDRAILRELLIMRNVLREFEEDEG